MKRILFTSLILIIICFSNENIYAQNIGINADGSKPNANAMLDIKSANKGILIPRTSTTSRTAIPNTKGLLVYDTTTNSFWYNDGVLWNNLSSNSSGWSLSGNSNTDTAKNFIGTKDGQPLLIKVNNTLSGVIDYNPPDNTAWGYQALYSNTTGYSNTAAGSQALISNTTGFGNTTVGYQSSFDNTIGVFNTATGYQALQANSTGIINTAIGVAALQSNKSGSANTAIGFSALGFRSYDVSGNTAVGTYCAYSNLTGIQITAVGDSALYNNSDGSVNTAIGNYALFNNTTGNLNTATGVNALYHNTVANDNTADGVNALLNNVSGNQNTAVGSGALYDNNFGSNNTAIGYLAGVNPRVSNATAIGANARVNFPNSIQLGDANIIAVNSAGTFNTVSDGRFKFNVKENVKGLDFILKLKPVTYQLNVQRLNENKSTISRTAAAGNMNPQDITVMNKRRTGFIAQQVEKAANETGFDFDAIHKPENDNDHYSLSYAGFVVPLVKSVQELSAENDALKNKVNELQKQQQTLINIVNILNKKMKTIKVEKK